jgi:hypothetical protein
VSGDHGRYFLTPFAAGADIMIVLAKERNWVSQGYLIYGAADYANCYWRKPIVQPECVRI